MASSWWAWGTGLGVMERLPASKLLARRPEAGRGWRPEGATKLTRPRRLKPVEERLFFFSKSSGAGRVPFVDLLVMAISRGEPGEGGELERVVLEDLFIEKRRPLGGGPLVMVEPPREVSEAGAESMMALVLVCEVERRKRLESERLKLPVEPRVDRRESGVGGRSCCCC